MTVTPPMEGPTADPTAPAKPPKRRRPTSRAEWEEVTGGLVEERELARVPCSRGVFVVARRVYARVPPYVVGWWEAPEGRRLRARVTTCTVEDARALSEAYAAAADALTALGRETGEAP